MRPLPSKVMVPGSGTTVDPLAISASEFGVMKAIFPSAPSSTAYKAVPFGSPLAVTDTLPPGDSAVFRSTNPNELALPKPKALRLLLIAPIAPFSGKLDKLTKAFPLRLAPPSDPAEAAIMMTSFAALPLLVNTLNVLPVRTNPTDRPLPVPPPSRAISLVFPQLKLPKLIQLSASAETLKIRTAGIARARNLRARERIAEFLRFRVKQARCQSKHGIELRNKSILPLIQ